ncbi:uncharacterized protein LOC105205567 [Solenopsis invicta]|uniref:uncharacterized protein LOC105205567 n=1 Tax=Solenopsis invicta TaxID=13686 RepID=UPI0005961063|nr:uncharacterized protein LOC105205567 [Solenopsis invicta]
MQQTAKILQINLARSFGAQDLMLQKMTEDAYDIAAISEPYRIPMDSKWVALLENPPLAALTWHGSIPATSTVIRGKYFILVYWNNTYMASCYFPPSTKTGSFKTLLNDLGDAICPFIRQPLLVLRDFNA